MAAKPNGGGGGNQGGRRINVENVFPNDLKSQELWRDTFEPLQKKMRQMMAGGVRLPEDLSIPDRNSEGRPTKNRSTGEQRMMLKGLREGETELKNPKSALSQYYRLWCLKNAIHQIDKPGNGIVPYIFSSREGTRILQELRLDRTAYPSGPAGQAVQAFYELFRRRNDIIESNCFRDLMVDPYHIGHYLWEQYYGSQIGNRGSKVLENPPNNEVEISQRTDSPYVKDYMTKLAAVTETEKTQIVKQRIGQDVFRDALLQMWEGACAICGLAVPELLRASHAKPWAECETDAERLDVFNGFLLSTQFDALFDSGLMTFDNAGGAIFSEQLSAEERNKLGLSGSYRLRSKPDSRHLPYLNWHREKVFCQTK